MILFVLFLKIEKLQSERDKWSKEERIEVDSILARLEEAKRRIVELEKRKLELSHEQRSLQDKYEEDELSYKSKVR